jgi:hypothetical protein
MKKTGYMRFGIPKFLFTTVFIIFALLINSCKESSNVNSSMGTSPTKASVRTLTTISDKSVSGSNTVSKIPGIAAFHSLADSLVITRARVVISTLKLHQLGIADTDTVIVNINDGHGKNHDKDKDEDEKDIIVIIDRDDGTIRVGPFVAEFDGSGEKIISEVTIPPGTYDRMGFQIHKLNENDDPALLNDSLFGDFVNGGRYTFIIDGLSYVNGKAYPFEFKSAITANVTIDISPPAIFNTSAQYDLRLVFDPKIVFTNPGMKPLDPRDPDNQEAIEQMLQQSIRLLK